MNDNKLTPSQSSLITNSLFTKLREYSFNSKKNTQRTELNTQLPELQKKSSNTLGTKHPALKKQRLDEIKALEKAYKETSGTNSAHPVYRNG